MTDPAALEAAARALYEMVRTNPIPWEQSQLQDEVRAIARKTVQAYLRSLPSDAK